VQRITGEPARFMALAAWAETMAAKVHVVADFCDDLAAAGDMYDSPVPAAYQAQLLRACAAVASTEALREQLLPQARFDVSVIEDPYERETAQPPAFIPQPKVRLAWFGVFGPPLMPFLTDAFSAVAGRVSPRPAELRFITHVSQAGLARELGEKLRAVHPGFMLHFVPWSREAVAAELAKAHLVLLPQDTNGPWGRVKSHNRLVESLRAGRFAIASPIPSYVEMKDYAWVGASLGDGVLWALSHRNAVLAKIRAGQMYVEQRFTPKVIGERWAKALRLDGDNQPR
jgi:glycosyltransferase involved in cell wall biosynthesis